MDLLRAFISVLKKIWYHLTDIVWNKMELKRVFQALTAVFRTIFRIAAFPILLIDSFVERIRNRAVKYNKKPKRPTDKQVKKKMISSVIDTIVSHKNNVAGYRALNRFKASSIVLLEIASFITTTIGMTIVAADISPLIAIIWALVIQGLAGALSGFRGKWNNIILVVCLIFSIGSDYVCYVNAVFPYDQYIESSYTDFKVSYDMAWKRALSLVQEYESLDEKIETSFNNVEQGLALLKRSYNPEVFKVENDNLRDLKEELNGMDSYEVFREGYDVSYDQEGNPTYTSKYTSVPNQKYDAKLKEVERASETVDKLTDMLNSIREIDANLLSLKKEEDFSARDTAKRLFSEEKEDPGSAANAIAVFSEGFANIQRKVNGLLAMEAKPTFAVIELSGMRYGNANYNAILELQLPGFSEIRSEVLAENDSVFDKLFADFAMIIDSDFAANAVDMKKKAELFTHQYYERFMEAISGMVKEDKVLADLVYGEDDAAEAESRAVAPLVETYKNTEYQDALSKAFTYLLEPGDNVLETYSRVLYACLADGLVLLIGFSLRRRRTSIYHVRNQRDLMKEEPRLISEALYNLSARPVNDDPATAYKVETLLTHLRTFITCFEPEPFMRDANLDMNFSLICKRSESMECLNEEFKELICLLQTLKHVKPISAEQYTFFTKYKLNKSSLDGQSISNALPALEGKCDEYYYLMTEGFSLYLAEKMNDLHQQKESEVVGDALFVEMNLDEPVNRE